MCVRERETGDNGKNLCYFPHLKYLEILLFSCSGDLGFGNEEGENKWALSSGY